MGLVHCGSFTTTTGGTTSVDIGAASGTRLVIVAVSHAKSSGTGLSISSGTIDGIAATIATQLANNTTTPAGSGILYAETTSGGPINVVVTLNSAAFVLKVNVYVIDDYTSATPFSVASAHGNPASVSVNYDNGGIAIGAGASTIQTITWTGLDTVDDTEGAGAPAGWGAASSIALVAATGHTVTLTPSVALDAALSVATWRATTVAPTPSTATAAASLPGF